MSLGRHPAKRLSEGYHLTPVVSRSLRPRVPRRLVFTEEEPTMPAKKIVKKTKKKVEVAPAPAYKPVEEEKVKPEEEGAVQHPRPPAGTGERKAHQNA